MALTVQDLLNAAVCTTELQTEVIPIPVGTYQAAATSYKLKVFPPKEAGKDYVYIAEVTFRINDPEVAEEVKRDNPTARLAIFLKLTSEGALAPNNLGLGRLTKATDGLELGEVSLQEALDSALGVDVGVRIKHRIVEENVYDEIAAVIPIDELEE